MQGFLQNQDVAVQYEWALVRNVKNACELGAKAADPDGMNCFVRQGTALRMHGGIFEFDIDPYCRVTSVYRQTANNQAYLKQYGDCISCDGYTSD